MSSALMRVCETGDYETAKLLIEEFVEFGGFGIQNPKSYNVDFKIQKIYMCNFIGKTIQEKQQMVKKYEECCGGAPIDDEMINLIKNDEALSEFCYGDWE
jgi:hypothetical protein